MICIMHALPFGEHFCLYCCLCFKDIAPEECHVLSDGMKEDVCIPCFEAEEAEARRRGVAPLMV